MISVNWNVRFSRNAGKQYEKLKKNGIKPSIIDIIDMLVIEMERLGPERSNWPNYGKLSSKSYHCHLKKGKAPTYVACWITCDEKQKQIEIYYVGTHENAPY